MSRRVRPCVHPCVRALVRAFVRACLRAYSEEEGALTRRVRSPELARALASIVNREEVRVSAVAALFAPLSVLVARSLRTRLFLKPRTLHFLQGCGVGGGGEGEGSAGEAMLDVTASEDGADVLYYVDLERQRIILSDALPPGLDLCNALAMAIDQVRGCLRACVCVCVCVCMCVCGNVHGLSIYLSTHARARTHAHMHACMHVYVYKCMYIIIYVYDACMHACMYMYTNVCISSYMCMTHNNVCVHVGFQGRLAASCCYRMCVFYYRMCCLTRECVLLLWNEFFTIEYVLLL